MGRSTQGTGKFNRLSKSVVTRSGFSSSTYNVRSLFRSPPLPPQLVQDLAHHIMLSLLTRISFKGNFCSTATRKTTRMHFIRTNRTGQGTVVRVPVTVTVTGSIGLADWILGLIKIIKKEIKVFTFSAALSSSVRIIVPFNFFITSR